MLLHCFRSSGWSWDANGKWGAYKTSPSWHWTTPGPKLVSFSHRNKSLSSENPVKDKGRKAPDYMPISTRLYPDYLSKLLSHSEISVVQCSCTVLDHLGEVAMQTEGQEPTRHSTPDIEPSHDQGWCLFLVETSPWALESLSKITERKPSRTRLHTNQYPIIPRLLIEAS